MYIFVMLVFVFSIGAIVGWGVEVIYRHLADKEKRWFNPGFCVGPWLPIYGIGLTVIYGITYIEEYLPMDNIILERIVLFVIMSICMTIIELIAGVFLLKCFNTRLWDYTEEKFNFKGFICLKFSFFWMILSAAYYFLIHPHITESIIWLSKNLIFSFVIGMIFGVFLIDIIYSANVLNVIKNYANEKQVIVRFEEIKNKIQTRIKAGGEKTHFFVFMLKENLVKFIAEKH